MNKLSKLLLPTRIELIIYAIIATTIFVISHSSSFLDVIAGEEFSDEVGSVYSNSIESFLEKISEFELSAQASLIIFWVIFAVVLYVVANVAHNLWVEAKNDITVESNFVHPQHYTHDNFWLLLAQRSLFRIAMAVVLVAYSYAVFNLLLPLWIELFDRWISNIGNWTSWTHLIVGYIGMGITLQLYVIFFRLFLMRVRVLDKT